MTNADKQKTYADKYLKDGVDVEELTDKILEHNEQNRNCTFYENMRSFWESEVKPTLTEDEEVILKRINKDFEAIRRGVNSKVLQLWSDDTGYVGIDIFDEGLFSWIQPRRRI